MAAAPRRRIIIDTDAGVDDAQALFLALRSPRTDYEILGIVCTHGNVGLPLVEQNVLAVTEACGSTVPVFSGADRPMMGAHHDASTWHGADGLGNTGYGLKAPRQRLQKEHGALAIARLALDSWADGAGQAVEIVTLGPLTTLALALRLHPSLPAAVAQVTVMGGAHQAVGNASLAAEYNIFEDPESAHIVLTGFPRIQLLTWETTLAHGLSSAELDAWLQPQPPTPHSTWLHAVSQHLIQQCEKQHDYAQTGFVIPDPLAMAAALHPELVLACTPPLPVVVERGGAYTRGMTVVDWSHPAAASGDSTPPPLGVVPRANVRIIQKLDMPALHRLLQHSVAAPAAPSPAPAAESHSGAAAAAAATDVTAVV